MTLVYPMHDIAGWDYGELRYSIRSFVANTHIDRVILVGFKPEWYTGEHIPFTDGPNKEFNIYSKLLKACEVADKFIFANDDHFMLRPDPIDYYYSKPLKGLGDTDSYGRKIKAVEDLFPDGKFFDIHCPMIIEADKMPLPYTWLPHEYIVKSLYCNHHGIEGMQMDDCKIPGFMTHAGIEQYTRDRSFMSLGPQALGLPMKEWLMNRWPITSQWEM